MMCGNITEHLLKDVSNCVAFSLQLDESTDIRDTAQLLVVLQKDVSSCVAFSLQLDESTDIRGTAQLLVAFTER
jgi:hypothetical protein